MSALCLDFSTKTPIPDALRSEIEEKIGYPIEENWDDCSYWIELGDSEDIEDGEEAISSESPHVKFVQQTILAYAQTHDWSMYRLSWD